MPEARDTLLTRMHDPFHDRRVRVLSEHIARAIPGPGRVLDLGAGDGQMALALMTRRPDLKVEGVDVVPRPTTQIPVTLYDGVTLPFPDKSFDFVTIVDVLHHTKDPALVLAEAGRVARQGVVIKDHLREGFLAREVLVAMDWFGNFGDGVPMPYTFLSRSEWQAAFARARLQLESQVEKLDIYVPPIRWICDRNLHFVALASPL
ncbi:MAG: class I SAM-dependent methyltransferase [Devosia sp.]